ncbi:MAG: hypothetical protein ACRDSR_28530, partial [Pseudonocardiaceae bacterium]
MVEGVVVRPDQVSLGVLVAGLCLFGEDDYEEVATKVTGSLSRWGCWDARWSVPTASGITQA